MLCHARQHASAVHGLGLVRSVFEPAIELLWAARDRWPRYWQAVATEQVAHHERRASRNPSHAEWLKTPAGQRLRHVAGSRAGMPKLRQLLEGVEADDKSDPVLRDLKNRLPASEVYEILVQGVLHPCSHGDPRAFASERWSDAWIEAGQMYLYSAVQMCRAAHLQRGWRQEPIWWAYQWITRIERDPHEPSPSPDDSYGDLGLTPGLSGTTFIGPGFVVPTEAWAVGYPLVP